MSQINTDAIDAEKQRTESSESAIDTFDDLSARKQLLAERKLRIVFVVPVMNEADLIVPFLEALIAKCRTITDNYYYVVVDDGSDDQTAACARSVLEKDDQPHQLVIFSRNFGKEQALAAGLQNCDGDVTCLIDSDFQHPLDTIDKFISSWVQGYDMIYGVQSQREQPWIKRVFSSLFYNMMHRITRIKIPPHAGDFRLMDRKVVAALNRCTEHSKFMKGLYAWVGFRSVAVSFVAHKRAKGVSRFRYRHLTELALTGMISFSDLPLRIWALLGVVIALLSFIVALIIIIDTLVFGVSVPGYATLLVCIIFFGGLQLLSVGILGEYISRIFNEVKPRPPFIVSHHVTFDNTTSESKDKKNKSSDSNDPSDSNSGDNLS